MKLKFVLCLILSLVITLNLSFTAFATSTTPVFDNYNVGGTYGETAVMYATDLAGKTVNIYYPAGIASTTDNYPIVVFAPGTNPSGSWSETLNDSYTTLINTIVSWGYVVIANRNGMQGNGTDAINAGNYLKSLNTTSSSIFYNRLDVNSVAVMGHSQGACAAVNAATGTDITPKLTGVKACIPLSLVQPFSLLFIGCMCDPTKLGNIPTLFLSGGSEDFIMCPTFINDFWYSNTARLNVPSAKASIVGAPHMWINDTADTHPTDKMGYIIAFLEYSVRGDSNARSAFVGTSPEIINNTNYSDVAISNLP